jgi:hypothetical protein
MAPCSASGLGRRPGGHAGPVEDAGPGPIVFRLVDRSGIPGLLKIDQLLPDRGTLELGVVPHDAPTESGEHDGGRGEGEAARVISVHRSVPQISISERSVGEYE